MEPDDTPEQTTNDRFNDAIRHINLSLAQLSVIQQSPDTSRALSLSITNVETGLLWLWKAFAEHGIKAGTA